MTLPPCSTVALIVLYSQRMLVGDTRRYGRIYIRADVYVTLSIWSQSDLELSEPGWLDRWMQWMVPMIQRPLWQSLCFSVQRNHRRTRERSERRRASSFVSHRKFVLSKFIPLPNFGPFKGQWQKRPSIPSLFGCRPNAFFCESSVAWCSQLEYIHVSWSVVTVQFYVSDYSLSIIVNTTSLS